MSKHSPAIVKDRQPLHGDQCMVSPIRWQRQGRLTLWLIAAFTLLFVALTAYHLLMRFRASSDSALLAELQRATILEDARPDGPSDWPQFRGLRRDGVSSEKDLLPDWTSQTPKFVWKADCGDGFSAVTVSDGRAFTLSANKDHSAEIVYCWNAETGKELWRHEYPCNYVNSYG